MTYSVKKFLVGPLETNTYVISSDNGTPSSCCVIDPSLGCREVIAFIRKQNLTIDGILLTHGHFDHIMGIPELLEEFPGTPVWIHKDEAPLIADADSNGSSMIGEDFSLALPVNYVETGVMTVGRFSFRVIVAPGHSPGGCAFLFDNECFCGDLLFAGSIGRYDLPGGDGARLIEGIRNNLLTLPDETVVNPGHGGRTTIGREKRMNPFFT